MICGLLDILGPEASRWRAKMRRHRYGRNETVFREGDPGDTLHVIDKGRVLVETTTSIGNVAALSVRGPGEVIGELALVGNGRRTASVTALEPTETLSLTQGMVEDLRTTDSNFDRYLVELLAEKLAETMAQLMEVLFVPVNSRVLRVVDRLATAFDDGQMPIVIRVRQEDIAAMAGTRRQTANRPLKAAEAKGAVRIGRGSVEIVDRELLRELGR
ncbi:MAG: Crp/Fnr family transcriptional regulator [Acidimicrobiaceae bacterium]|nr:Crp/Fnr family transcriptional regulator [Acidimicrobiaceae bacterium]MBT5850377.1 Crp/Fnr family transcriptional regulator [Acidimicrobiaceae bacterium]